MKKMLKRQKKEMIYSRKRSKRTRFYILDKKGYKEIFFAVCPEGLKIVYGDTYTESDVLATEPFEQYHHLYNDIQIDKGQKIIPIECFTSETLDKEIYIEGIKSNDQILYTKEIGVCKNILDEIKIRDIYIKHDGKISLATYMGLRNYEPNEYVFKQFGVFKVIYDVK